MKNLFLIILFLVSLTTATTIQLSNTSKDYQICIYRADGGLEGCATSNNSVYISRNDYIFSISLKEQNLLSLKTIFGIYGTFIFLILMFILIVFIAYSLGIFTKTIK